MSDIHFVHHVHVYRSSSQVSPKSVPTPDWRVHVPNNFQCMSTNKHNKNDLIVAVQVCLVMFQLLL